MDIKPFERVARVMGDFLSSADVGSAPVDEVEARRVKEAA